MTEPLRKLSRRAFAPAAALFVSSLLVGSIGLADHSFEEGVSSGDVHKGTMYVPLIWGAAMQPEALSVAVPGNCQRTIDMTIRWDEDHDWVKVRLKGRGVLEPYPTVDRTQGVDFFPNPWWPEQKSFVNGRYQFWFISNAEEHTFYYDHNTLDLIGSDLDFATPPPGAIEIPIPIAKVLGSEFFQPSANGDVDVEWTWKYSGLVRLDRPEFSHMFGAFPPPNLCGSNQYRYDLSTTRGYISEPRPASEARPFSAYLKNGLIFQITIEPPQYPVEPPRDTQTATYNNATVFGGLVPPGYTWDIDAAFMNLAPGIKPFGAMGQCVNFFSGVHTKNLNFCGP